MIRYPALMIRTVAVEGYRSLRDVKLPLGQLNVITGANGSGKSSVYRSLRLLADVAQNEIIASPLARAVCHRRSGLVQRPLHAVFAKEPCDRAPRKSEGRQPQARIGRNSYGYSIDLGYPQPLRPPLATTFKLYRHV